LTSRWPQLVHACEPKYSERRHGVSEHSRLPHQALGLRCASLRLGAAPRALHIPRMTADYKFEVLAIELSGNQTITEGSFQVAP